jgi:hypothetical protein
MVKAITQVPKPLKLPQALCCLDKVVLLELSSLLGACQGPEGYHDVVHELQWVWRSLIVGVNGCRVKHLLRRRQITSVEAALLGGLLF